MTRFFAVAGIHAAIGQRQLDVFIDREIADQIKTLKDETDFAIANARALRQAKGFPPGVH